MKTLVARLLLTRIMLQILAIPSGCHYWGCKFKQFTSSMDAIFTSTGLFAPALVEETCALSCSNRWFNSRMGNIGPWLFAKYNLPLLIRPKNISPPLNWCALLFAQFIFCFCLPSGNATLHEQPTNINKPTMQPSQEASKQANPQKPSSQAAKQPTDKTPSSCWRVFKTIWSSTSR